MRIVVSFGRRPLFPQSFGILMPIERLLDPWGYGHLIWQHNGMIAGFRSIIRKLQADLNDEFFEFPSGSTDSEYAFAVFLQILSTVRSILRLPGKIA
jgi:hypothetical protein